jgi:SAM-dependent methyltransferase
LPIAGTHFIDISAPVIERLNGRGGIAAPGEIGALPFSDREFDLACAFDVIEHAEDDRRVFGEMNRVLKRRRVLIPEAAKRRERLDRYDRRRRDGGSVSAWGALVTARNRGGAEPIRCAASGAGIVKSA